MNASEEYPDVLPLVVHCVLERWIKEQPRVVVEAITVASLSKEKRKDRKFVADLVKSLRKK